MQGYRLFGGVDRFSANLYNSRFVRLAMVVGGNVPSLTVHIHAKFGTSDAVQRAEL